MKNAGKVIASAIIFSLTFQSAAISASHAEEVSVEIPVYDPRKTDSINWLDTAELSFMKDDNGEYYLGIGMKSAELSVPENINGKKISKIDLEHVFYSPSAKGSWTTAPVLYIPDGITIVNKHWKCLLTGISRIRIVYDSGVTEELKADDYQEMYEQIKPFALEKGMNENYIEDYMFYYLKYYVERDYVDYPDRYSPSYDKTFIDLQNMTFDTINTSFWSDYYKNGQNTYSWEEYSEIYAENSTKTDKESSNIKYIGNTFWTGFNKNHSFVLTNKHWLAAENGLLDITITNQNGITEYLKADDYDNFFPESGKFDKYVLLVNNRYHPMNLKYPDNVSAITVMPEYYFNMENISNFDDIVLFSGTFDSGRQYEEMTFPNIKGEYVFEPGVFENISIDKLILPEQAINLKTDAFGHLKCSHIVFQGKPKIDTGCFARNDKLQEVTFEKGADIGMGAFWSCSSLKNINTDISEPIDGKGFNLCTSLMTINGESPVNDDGSLKPKYEEFVRKSFNASGNIGFLNKYLEYRVKQAAKETVSEDMSDIEKVKALHDKVCSMVAYDIGNTDAEKNHVDISVFLNDTSVCEGYARALNLMLHEAGVESCFVVTSDHAWVIVKLGEHYFHVDPTWDDGDVINYNWFMKTDSQIDGKECHTNWKIDCPSSMHSFQWKKLPECTDMMGDADGNNIIDGRDATAILTSYAKVSVGKNEEVDSIIADYNFDGTVDARDASAVLTEYAKSSVEN